MLSGAILMQVLFVIVGVLVCAWGIRMLWRSNNKFLAVLFLVLMAGIGFAVYRIFGGNLPRIPEMISSSTPFPA